MSGGSATAFTKKRAVFEEYKNCCGAQISKSRIRLWIYWSGASSNRLHRKKLEDNTFLALRKSRFSVVLVYFKSTDLLWVWNDRVLCPKIIGLGSTIIPGLRLFLLFSAQKSSIGSTLFANALWLRFLFLKSWAICPENSTGFEIIWRTAVLQMWLDWE